ncbi:MAG: hypothetical protein QM607_10480 [Microbacterium sp.]
MTDVLEQMLADPDPSDGPGQADTRTSRKLEKKRRRRRVWNIVLTTFGVVLLVAGVGIGALTLFAPQKAEHAYATVKVGLASQLQQAREKTLGELPTVTFGVDGGLEELQQACGTMAWGDESWVHMTSYERDGVPPIWAAHNNCAGDVILDWQIGQRMMVEGDPTVYEVVEIRDIPKTYSSTADLVGLKGVFGMQTCYYDGMHDPDDYMKFIGLDVAKNQSHG